MKCPDCGNPVQPDAQFCPKCYARIEPPGLWQRLLWLIQGLITPSRPLIKVHKTVTIKTTDQQGQQHEYHSLAEVPPEMRAEVETLESEALKDTFRSSSKPGFTATITTEKSVSLFRVKDASGKERVYHSLEELPPEIRAAVERIKKKVQ